MSRTREQSSWVGDVERPFVEIGEGQPPALVSECPGGFVLELPLSGATIDELEVEVSPPYLIVRRGGASPTERRFALLAHVDPETIRASLVGERLRIEARRHWSRPKRVPILSDFLWEGRVAHRPGEPVPPRPRPRSTARV